MSAEMVQDAATTPFTSYTKWQKQLIVLSAATAALLTSLSNNIYLPALNLLAEHFKVSEAKINLTVTTYMIFQGIAPTFVGGFADRYGRRPAYAVCLTISVLANTGLSVTDSYAALLALRCLQSAGTSALQALCQAVVADIITSAERGHYVGIAAVPAILGPSLGPLLGGALAYSLGWRSIFVFIAICALINVVLIFLFFPETCRTIVGDGSDLPPRIYRTLLQFLKARRLAAEEPNNIDVPNPNSTTNTTSRSGSSDAVKKEYVLKIPFQALALFFNKELNILTLYGGLIFGAVQAIATVVPSQFATVYGLNTFQIGLMYLPIFAGSLVAVVLVGKGMNKNFARHAKKLGLPAEALDKSRQLNLKDFPVERARIEVGLPPLLLSIILVAAWGWALESRTSLAVPCVLAFFIGVGIVSVNNVISALITDVFPGKAGSAAAANNIGKFALAAVMSAVIQPLISAVGIGKAFTIIAGLEIVFSPFLILVMFRGMKWRRALRKREVQKEDTSRNSSLLPAST